MELRKVFTAILAACMALAISSCEEHVPEIDYSLKTGNILCADGRIVPQDAYDGNSMNGIGIIVMTGGENEAYKAIAVGKEDIGSHCYCDSLMNVAGVGSDITKMDGKENTAALMNLYMEEMIGVPAAEAASSYRTAGVTGWHLPSCGELLQVSKGGLVIKKGLELIGGQPMEEEWYISSTQDGASENTKILYMYCVSMQEGRVRYAMKNESYLVRPFITIK